jgi:Flp pilus assembly protein TadD
MVQISLRALRVNFAVFLLCWTPWLLAQGGLMELRSRALQSFREGRLPEAEQALRSYLKQRPQDSDALGFLGAVLDAQSKYQEAERYYLQAVKLAPRSVVLLNNLGNHYAALKDQEQARRQFLRVIAIDPPHRNANLQLARIALERKQGQEALDYLGRFQVQEPDIKLLRAEALNLAGHSAESTAALDEFEKSAASDPAALFALGLALARMERYGRAEQVFAQVLEQNPANAEALYSLGVAAARAGHLERAQGVLEVALKNRPEDGSILSALGRVYAAKGEYSRAVMLLADAHRGTPRDAQVTLALARSLDGAGYFRDAVAAYDEYLAQRPDDEAARSDRALDYAATGRREQAVAEMKRYIARFPQDPDGYFRLALITERRDQTGALGLLNHALEIEPGFASARYERGILLHRLGRSADALIDLQVAAEAEPNHSGILSQLGLVYLVLGRASEAEPVLRRAAELDPEGRMVMMHWGRALAEVGKEKESQAVLAKLENLSPANPAPDKNAGILNLLSLPRAQQLARSIASLQQAAQRKPGNTAIALQLGKALLEAGKNEEAVATFRAIKEADPATRREVALALNRCSGPVAALQELERIPSAARDGASLLLQAELLDEAGRSSEARQLLQENQPILAGVPEQALGAALLQFRWGAYQASLDLAGAAAPLAGALLVKAAALDRMGQTHQSEALLEEVKSRWPEWGAPYLVHGALLGWHGESQRALRMLNFAQTLGADAAALSKCLRSGGDCSLLAREILTAEPALTSSPGKERFTE